MLIEIMSSKQIITLSNLVGSNGKSEFSSFLFLSRGERDLDLSLLLDLLPGTLLSLLSPLSKNYHNYYKILLKINNFLPSTISFTTV